MDGGEEGEGAKGSGSSYMYDEMDINIISESKDASDPPSLSLSEGHGSGSGPTIALTSKSHVAFNPQAARSRINKLWKLEAQFGQERNPYHVYLVRLPVLYVIRMYGFVYCKCQYPRILVVLRPFLLCVLCVGRNRFRSLLPDRGTAGTLYIVQASRLYNNNTCPKHVLVL